MGTNTQSQWFTRGIDEMLKNEKSPKTVERLHKLFTGTKVAMALVGVAWLATRGTVHEDLNNIMSIVMAAVTIAVAVHTMVRLRNYWLTALWTKPEVAVLSGWELTFVWWLMFILAIISVCNIVPGWKQYVYFFL